MAQRRVVHRQVRQPEKQEALLPKQATAEEVFRREPETGMPAEKVFPRRAASKARATAFTAATAKKESGDPTIRTWCTAGTLTKKLRK